MSTVYTATIVIERPPADVFAYVSVPENQADWAVNFVRSTSPLGDGRYVMETPFGPMTYRVEADAARGTFDYRFETPDGESVMPTRVVPHARGAMFMFTITRARGSSDEDWQRGRVGLEEELTHLKARLEVAA
jgi:uncharacterized protein YndB with AHSA1/START domain